MIKSTIELKDFIAEALDQVSEKLSDGVVEFDIAVRPQDSHILVSNGNDNSGLSRIKFTVKLQDKKIVPSAAPKPTKEEWIAKKLNQYQPYYRENGRYYIDKDWTPTLDELKADLEKSYDFEVGE